MYSIGYTILATISFIGGVYLGCHAIGFAACYHDAQ